MKIVEKLKKVFNSCSEYIGEKLEENDRIKRGVVLNKFGQEILESKLTFKGYGVHSNVIEWGWQPRANEMRRAVEPILKKPDGDLFSLDEETGNIYISSELNRHGEEAKPLIQIDMAVEKKLFDFVAREVLTRKMFRGCSYKNPVCVDIETGRVYPQKNPSETRGKVTFGPTVHGPASGRRR